MQAEKDLEKSLGTKGISRRDFMKFCSAIAVSLGLGPSMAREVAAALTSSDRPPVLWLHFAECTGCTEAVLRTTDPWFDDLILNVLSLDYHETLMAGAGRRVHEILSANRRTICRPVLLHCGGSDPHGEQRGLRNDQRPHDAQHCRGDLPQSQGDHLLWHLRILWRASRGCPQPDRRQGTEVGPPDFDRPGGQRSRLPSQSHKHRGSHCELPAQGHPS